MIRLHDKAIHFHDKTTRIPQKRTNKTGLKENRKQTKRKIRSPGSQTFYTYPILAALKPILHINARYCIFSLAP